MPLDEEHPSGSAFNKFDTKTLMGNWVEEKALKAATGVSRVQSWVPPVDPNDTAVYAVHTSGPEFVPTNERCFIHTIAADHQPYLSHFTEMYKDPVSRQGEPVKYISETQKVGTRTDRMMQQFMAQAAVEPVVAETKTDFTTTKQASYTQQDMSQVKVGLRVMKTQDGVELGLLDRDAVFLAEHGMDTKERLDRARLGQLDTAAVTGHYAGNEAYSVYSQEAELEQYPSGLATTGTAPKGPNPFGKNCKFSKPIGDFTKDVTEE